MMRISNKTIPNKTTKMYIDYDYHDFMEMRESGLSDTEIAHELGVNDIFMKELGLQIKKDY